MTVHLQRLLLLYVASNSGKKVLVCELPCIRAEILQNSALRKFSSSTRAVHEKEKVIQKSGLHKSPPRQQFKDYYGASWCTTGVRRDPPSLRPEAKYA